MDQQNLKAHFSTLDKKSFRAGDMIFYQGEVPRGVYVVKTGIVKAYTISQNGEERIVDFNADGETLAISWVFGNTTSTIYYYQALTDCEVYTIPKQHYTEYASQPKVMLTMMSQLAGHYTAALIRITALEQARARDKILFTFYYLVKRFGKDITTDWSTLQIALTHQMIADLVGLTRETTAVELNAIKKTKILSYKRQKYLVHVGRLLKAIDEDSFATITL
jgi:CRP-like cAMP-binding protein